MASSSTRSPPVGSSVTPSSILSPDNAIAAAEHPHHNPPSSLPASPPPPPPPTATAAAPTPRSSGGYTLAATFAAAGLGNALSACCTNPADIVKVRQQLVRDKQRNNFVRVAGSMLRDEGARSFFNGVTASCLRELTYSTVRFGLYETFKDLYSDLLGVSEQSFALKALSGITSGAIGSAFACPTDLLKVRMQANRPNGRPPYRNTFVGFAEVFREGARAPGAGGSAFVGGVKSLYRGVWPTTIRAAVLTSSQIGSYDQVKSMVKRAGLMDEGLPLHFSASLVAGLFASIASAPFDTIKVRLMQDKEREFKNAFDCVGKLIKNEGPLALYKGFAMCWARLGSHTVISLILFEEFRALFGVKPL
ncbi:uncharacterized protein PFL1_01466 [Pseudozyma flocculosa PF-1]|uniref:uncharacterized protein n=1 Tax=Pseudozyma flocculosa PF-1 TaxID=1277687 RepID=UPI000456101D|nr:uncharacterized protein PFL1_01466 [Pseudozyma flocculosa PF-1]EPQ31281.1 hypothetical protein PFL1_01466 [Pseudozyma flocculosa PF-1]